MATVFLLLGSNMGDRESFLFGARNAIELAVGPIIGVSSLYQTASWGKTDQPDFINQVLKVQTALLPDVVLDSILDIETQLGRLRSEKWSSRTIDIDILFYNQEEINKPDLKIPHPNLHQRAFTLVPLVEIEPECIHPVFNKSVSTLLEELNDPLSVQKLNP